MCRPRGDRGELMDSLVVEGIAPEGNEDIVGNVVAAQMEGTDQTVVAGSVELGHKPHGVRDADDEE